MVGTSNKSAPEMAIDIWDIGMSLKKVLGDMYNYVLGGEHPTNPKLISVDTNRLSRGNVHL